MLLTALGFCRLLTSYVLYRPNELAEHIEVKFDENTVWLTQAQIAELFGTEIPAISKHINNIYTTDELDKASTVSILETVRQEGDRTVRRKMSHYNLDMILSVGYRVNSINATLFRRWATDKLKNYLLKGYAMNTRMERIEKRVDEIDLQIKTHLIRFFLNDPFIAY